MTITSDIADRRARHKPVLHLVEQHIKETAEQIAYESSTASMVNAHLANLNLILGELTDIASTPFGFALVQRELDAAQDRRMALLTKLMISALVKPLVPNTGSK